MGLVLSGGGGKGSYHIGVFQALQEYGLHRHIYALAGTSVGALNTGLFLQKDLDLAQKIWMNISPHSILSLPAPELLNRLLLLPAVKSLPPLALLWARRLAWQGFFSQEGLLEILLHQIDLTAIKDAPMPAYATCFNLHTLAPEYFCLNGLPTHEIASILLASSAIPLLFGSTEIHGHQFLDGGLGDNVPITPLYRLGCELIVVVYLQEAPEIHRDLYPGCTILPIVPRRKLGGIISGTLDFHPDSVQERIKQGYEDASSLLLPYRDLGETEVSTHFYSQKEEGAREKEQKERRIHLQGTIQAFDQGIWGDVSSWEQLPAWKGDLPLDREGVFLDQKEEDLLHDQIRLFLDRNQENHQLLMEAAFEAISFLSPIEGRSTAFTDQGPFSPFLYAVTGKPLQLVGENQRDLARAQYAALSLIGRLHQQGLLTLDFLAALTNHLERLYMEIMDTREGLHDLSAAVYRSLSLLLHQLRREITKDRERIDSTAQQVALMDWLTHIEIHQYRGLPYTSLEVMEQAVCLVNDFFRLTGGEWTVKGLHSLKQAWLQLGSAGEMMDTGRFFATIFSDPSLKSRLHFGLSREGVGGREKLFPVREEGKRPLPLYDLALELLYTMAQRGYRVKKVHNRAKEDLMQRLVGIKEIMEGYGFVGASLQEVEELMTSMKDFQMTLPLLGTSHSQKSLLWRQYLKAEYVSPNLSLESAVATEIHFVSSGFERLEAYYVDGSIREYPLSLLQRIGVKAQEVLYQRLFLKRPQLADQELMLVDLPGLDSNLHLHREAITRYLEAGDYPVLFLTEEDSLDSFLDLFSDTPVLEYALLLEERVGVPDSPQAFFVGQVSVKEGDYRDLKKGLEHISGFWEKTLAVRYGPAISLVTKQLVEGLQALMAAEDVSLETLEEKRQLVKKKKGGLEALLAEEKERIMGVLGSEVLPQITRETRDALSGQRDVLLEDLRSGRPIQAQVEGLIKNTFNSAVERHTRPVFMAAVEKFSWFFSTAVDVVSSELEVIPLTPYVMTGLNERLYLFGTTALGLLFLGPIGLLFGGLYGVFQSRQRKRQQEEQLDRFLEDLSGMIEEKGEEFLLSLGQQFILLLQEQGEKRIKQKQELFLALEKEIGKSKTEWQRRREKMQQDLFWLTDL